ncbi:hypothetical protein ACQ4WX_08905 [Streptomyces lasalocidi]
MQAVVLAVGGAALGGEGVDLVAVGVDVGLVVVGAELVDLAGRRVVGQRGDGDEDALGDGLRLGLRLGPLDPGRHRAVRLQRDVEAVVLAVGGLALGHEGPVLGALRPDLRLEVVVVPAGLVDLGDGDLVREPNRLDEDPLVLAVVVGRAVGDGRRVRGRGGERAGGRGGQDGGGADGDEGGAQGATCTHR